MTDPERISQRGAGLAAHLLKAGASELPEEASVERALRALGVSGAMLSASAAVSGANVSSAATAGGGAGTGVAGGAAAAAGSTAKAVSATFLLKWIGIGVVGGVGLAGTAVVATGPSTPKRVVAATSMQEPRAASAPEPVVQPPGPVVAAAPPALAPPVASSSTPRPSASVVEPETTPAAPEEGAPLAAEVAAVDRARSQLAAGQAAQTLATLQGYEEQFPAARLLPEVLFLRLEAGERLGRTAESRTAAQRLVDAFPQSPHASSARKLLGP